MMRHRLNQSAMQSSQHGVPLPQQLMHGDVIQLLCAIYLSLQPQYLLRYQNQMCNRYCLNHYQLSLVRQ